MYTHAEVTRTLAAVPGPVAWKVAVSLIHARPVSDEVRAAVPELAAVIDAHQHDDRYADLPTFDPRGRYDPDLSPKLGSMCTHAEVMESTIVVDFWQFDYGEQVHAHVGVYEPGAYNRVIPTLAETYADMVGLTTRSAAPFARYSTGSARSVSGMEELMDYVFGDDTTTIPSAKNIDPNRVFTWCAVDTISGPDLADPVWDRDPKLPGHDLVYDATRGGLTAVRGVYHIAR